MTVFKDEQERRRCALEIATDGYTVVGISPNKNIGKATKELQRACPAARVKYVSADDDYFIDANWWSTRREEWFGFSIEKEKAADLTPEDFGVLKAR